MAGASSWTRPSSTDDRRRLLRIHELGPARPDHVESALDHEPVNRPRADSFDRESQALTSAAAGQCGARHRRDPRGARSWRAMVGPDWMHGPEEIPTQCAAIRAPSPLFSAAPFVVRTGPRLVASRHRIGSLGTSPQLNPETARLSDDRRLGEARRKQIHSQLCDRSRSRPLAPSSMPKRDREVIQKVRSRAEACRHRCAPEARFAKPRRPARFAAHGDLA